MILTDYYKFERLEVKSKSRMDCTASTRSYPEFEEKRAVKACKATKRTDATNVDSLVIYYNNVPSMFGGDVHRKAGKSISIKGSNLSSVYVPDPIFPLGYGDVKGTSDAILFVFHSLEVVDGVIQSGGIIEMFIARGKSKDSKSLYDMLSDGELDEEMESLRDAALQSSNTEHGGGIPDEN